MKATTIIKKIREHAAGILKSADGIWGVPNEESKPLIPEISYFVQEIRTLLEKLVDLTEDKKAKKQINKYCEYVNRDVTMCIFNLNYDDEWYEITQKMTESYNNIADELEKYKWDK